MLLLIKSVLFDVFLFFILRSKMGLKSALVRRLLLPRNKHLANEVDQLFYLIEEKGTISERELQLTLAKCVGSLMDNPIKDPAPLRQILKHFIFPGGRRYRYDYVQLVDEAQDAILSKLNNVLFLIDPNYPNYMRELGERSKVIFSNWEKLCDYSDIYIALAAIIQLEQIYEHLSVYQVLLLILSLDRAIDRSSTKPTTKPFKAELSVEDQYHMHFSAIQIYQTNNAYVSLTGDSEFNRVPSDIQEYFDILMFYCRVQHVTQQELDKVKWLDQYGQKMFKKLKSTQ